MQSKYIGLLYVIWTQFSNQIFLVTQAMINFFSIIGGGDWTIIH